MNNPIKRIVSVFKTIGLFITTIVNSVLLSIVYIAGVGITSIVAKLFGKSFLETKLSKESKSYWSNLNYDKNKKEDYYRQF